MAQKPLLDLSTLIERERVNIDGTPYELRNPDELSIVESTRLTRNGEEIERLHAAGPEAADQLDEVITDTARCVLVDVPDDVFDRLSGMQRLAVAEVFTERLLAARMQSAGAMAERLAAAGVTAETMQHPTGASSSRGSKGTSAGRRKTGSRKRRSA